MQNSNLIRETVSSSGEIIVFSCVGIKRITTCRKMTLDLCLISLTKTNSKWIKGLNIRPVAVKFLGENIGKKSPTFVLAMILWINTKSTSNKSKSQQVGLHQTKMLLHRRRNTKHNDKESFRMEENICKSYMTWG